MPDRLITNTSQPMRHPWPDDMHVQGGRSGLVFTGGSDSYTTAFVEACPSAGGTFLRGEGDTLEAAEDSCWAKYVIWRDCPHDQGYDRGPYHNGAAFCLMCGTWLNKVLPPLPSDPNRKPSQLDKLFAAFDPDRDQ